MLESLESFKRSCGRLRMFRELELFEKSEMVRFYEIFDYKEGLDFYFLKICVELIDGSVFYI